jgi:hypothetical protein
MDPKKLLDRIPRPDRDKPFRNLARRLVQGLTEAVVTNRVAGTRTAPGQYLVIRLVADDSEQEAWELQFADGRSALLKELEREAASREIALRSGLGVTLLTLTEQERESGSAAARLASQLEPAQAQTVLARLVEERELILPRRSRTLQLESEPSEAQVYREGRPVGVTPCTLEDLPEGEHRLTFVRPGYLRQEETVRIQPGPAGNRTLHRAVLVVEPAMGAVEVRTFPPSARVTVGGETRRSPATFRLPTGPCELSVELDDFEPEIRWIEVPPAGQDRPHRVEWKLRYNGHDSEELVGRISISSLEPEAQPIRREPVVTPVGAYFQSIDGPCPHAEWALPPSTHPEHRLLAERPLKRGVVIIGRRDPRSETVPDISLLDGENSVSRGCHAWLYVYRDTSTGAAYNTFLIGNNSSQGIRVDGELVMGTRSLSDEAEIEIGNFRLRLWKETSEPRVEFAV